MIQKINRLIVVCLILVCACQKMPDLSNNDGTPVSAEDVYNAFYDAWGNDNLDAEQIRVNEKVWLSKSFQLFNANVQEVGQYAYTVLRKADETEDINGTPTLLRNVYIAATMKDLTDPSSENTLTRELKLGFNVPSPSVSNEMSAQSIEPEPISIQNVMAYMTACIPDPKNGWNPSCFNLKTWDSVGTAPDLNKNGCPGLTNCKINIRNISFDLVSTTSANGTQTRHKTSFKFKFTRDLPYLSRLVSLCFQGMGAYNKQPFVATVCTEVTDYDPGTP